MPVALMMPTTSSGGDWHGQMPLTASRRYARGRGNSRWHRPRCGVQFPVKDFGGRIALHYWCGVTGYDSPERDLWTTDEIPDGEPACGTCVGRALGAGQDDIPTNLPPLVFDPRWQKPPKWCPGSRTRTLWRQVGRSHSVGECLGCGELVAIRALGRGYSAYGAGPVLHYPGAALVSPCPFHAWQRLTVREERVACTCGWPYDLAVTS